MLSVSQALFNTMKIKQNLGFLLNLLNLKDLNTDKNINVQTVE